MKEEIKLKYSLPTVMVIKLRINHIICMSNRIEAAYEDDYDEEGIIF